MIRALLRLPLVLAKLLLALAVVIYYLVVRGFIAITLVYVCTYFFLGTDTFAHMLGSAISGEIPGSITAATVRWGPRPDEVTLTNARVGGEDGQTVMRFGVLRANLDVTRTVTGMSAWLVRGQGPMTLRFEEAFIGDAFVSVGVAENGDVDFERAFHVRDPRKVVRPDNLDIGIDAITIEGLSGIVHTPEVRIEIQGMQALGNWNLLGDADVHFGVSEAMAEHVDVFIEPADRPTPALQRLAMAIEDLEIERYDFHDNVFTIGRVVGTLDGGRVSVTGGMNSRHPIPRWHAQVALDLPAGSKVLSDFTGGAVEGGFKAELRGKGDVKWAELSTAFWADALTIGGYSASDLSLVMDIDPQVSPDASMTHVMEIRHGEASMFGGRVILDPATYRPSWARPATEHRAPSANRHDFKGRVTFDGVDPWRLLGSKEFGLDLDTLPFLKGSLEGSCLIRADVEEETGQVDILTTSEGLSITWRGTTSLPLATQYRFHGQAHWRDGPATSLAGQTSLAPIQRLDLSDVSLTSEQDEISVAGHVDMTAQTMDLEGTVDIRDLARFLSPLGTEAVGGHLRLKETHVRGPLKTPAIHARIRMDGARLFGRAVGTVTSDLHLSDGHLEVHQLDTVGPVGRLKTQGSITLWTDGFQTPHPTMPVTLDRLRVDELQLGRLLADDTWLASIALRGQGPIKTHARDLWHQLVGRVKLEATQINLGGERWRRGRARLTSTPRKLIIENAEVSFETGDRMLGSLTLQKRSGRMMANVRARDVPLRAFHWLQTHTRPFYGRLSADLTLEGTLQRPEVIGTVGLRGFGFDPIYLGNAELSLVPTGADRLTISANHFFAGMTLMENSYLELDRGVPSRLHLETTNQRADVFTIIPALEVPKTRLYFGQRRPEGEAATAKGTLDVPFRRRDGSWRLDFEGAPGDLLVEFFDGEVIYESLSEARVSLGPDGTRINAITLGRDGIEPLTFCGLVDEDLGLDLRFKGAVNLEVLRLPDVFSVMEGALRILSDPTLARELEDDRCLPDPDASVLRVTGQPMRPLFSGRVASSGLLLVPRGYAREFQIPDGHGLTLRPQMRSKRQWLNSGPGLGLAVALDDGSFEVTGEATLDGFTIHQVDVAVAGLDLFSASPGEYNLTMNPDVTLKIDNFGDEVRRTMSLAGDVRLTEARYYKSFDRLGRALLSNTVGKTEKFEAQLTTAYPWLKTMRLDLHVQGQDAAINSAFTLGRADVDTRLDVQIGGTVGNPEVYNRIDLLPGGLVSYQLFEREFEIVRGTLDFDGEATRPRIDLEAQTELTFYETTGYGGREEEERTVVLSLMITGRLPEPEVRLQSDDPSFDQGDLQLLLLTGKPRGNAHALDNQLFAFDFGNLVDAILKAPFIDDASVILTQAGGWGGQFTTAFGRTLKLKTRAVQETTETRVSAGFEFRINDAISMEGRLLRIDSASNPSQTYGARLRYRIPLD